MKEILQLSYTCIKVITHFDEVCLWLCCMLAMSVPHIMMDLKSWKTCLFANLLQSLYTLTKFVHTYDVSQLSRGVSTFHSNAPVIYFPTFLLHYHYLSSWYTVSFSFFFISVKNSICSCILHFFEMRVHQIVINHPIGKKCHIVVSCMSFRHMGFINFLGHITVEVLLYLHYQTLWVWPP